MNEKQFEAFLGEFADQARRTFAAGFTEIDTNWRHSLAEVNEGDGYVRLEQGRTRLFGLRMRKPKDGRRELWHPRQAR